MKKLFMKTVVATLVSSLAVKVGNKVVAYVWKKIDERNSSK